MKPVSTSGSLTITLIDFWLIEAPSDASKATPLELSMVTLHRGLKRTYYRISRDIRCTQCFMSKARAVIGVATNTWNFVLQ